MLKKFLLLMFFKTFILIHEKNKIFVKDFLFMIFVHIKNITYVCIDASFENKEPDWIENFMPFLYLPNSDVSPFFVLALLFS